jgi:Phage tail tube protein
MSLGEGVAVRTTYKFYASGVINANTLDDTTTAPGTAGGQALRRVSLTPAMKRTSYASAEIRTDRQVADFRLGARSVDGVISGELSPATYFDLIEAAHRDTRVGPVALSQVGLVSVAADTPSSAFTFGGGDPVALGLSVGDPIMFTGMTVAGNNNTNFVILGFSGATNEVVTVDPPPATQAPDVAFTCTRRGHSTIVPSVGIVSRKMALEVFHDDLDTGRLFQETRLAGYALKMPASGYSTIDVTLSGRMASSLAAPYFVAPNAETSTGICAAVSGAVLMNGTKLGVLTAIDFTLALPPSPAEVVGQDFAAEIFLGRAGGSGTLTAFLEDNTFFDWFDNETELQLLIRLDTTEDSDTPTIIVFLPRIKLSTAAVNYSGEGGQSISASYTALKYLGAAPGVAATTVRIIDTEV